MKSNSLKAVRQLCGVMLATALAFSGCAAPAPPPPVYVETPQGTRVEAVTMSTPRADAAAIRLRDGRVLVCGGTTSGRAGSVLQSAEIYDSSSRTFAPTGAMTTPREGQTITMLRDGRVLLVGGDDNIGVRSALASAEIFDPSSGAFTATGSMKTPREGHTATMLRDGRVLVAGGSDNGIHTNDSAEIFDPAVGTFSSAGHMTVPRSAHIAMLLRSGKVLIAGGGRGGRPGGYIAYANGELFNPASGLFSAIQSRMRSDRVGAEAAMLNDGRVLIVGGKSGRLLMPGFRGNLAGFTPLDTAEFYDPETSSFLPAPTMSAPHYLPTATSLDSGDVLVVGGYRIHGPTVVGMYRADIYSPARMTFSRTGSTSVARLSHTATLLDNGSVMVAGGIDANSNVTASVEFYSPRRRAFSMLPEDEPAAPKSAAQGVTE